MGTAYNLFATKNISKTRSSKELLEANLLLSCSKNSNHRIGFQLTCSKSSLQLVFMRGRNSLPFRVFCDIEISFYIG
ncbi:Lipoprotein lipase [Gossypium arboreum]|uniref:Lipoprotein lipase n=1 Tax=Gossypium arboreum TaxID=29729 RepID=A0A0B0MN87_GOSAR|nr:Lipoprotein lipase [Gossypium arboreum]